MSSLTLSRPAPQAIRVVPDPVLPPVREERDELSPFMVAAECERVATALCVESGDPRGRMAYKLGAYSSAYQALYRVYREALATNAELRACLQRADDELIEALQAERDDYASPCGPTW
jgi:hypothetical protein